MPTVRTMCFRQPLTSQVIAAAPEPLCPFPALLGSFHTLVSSPLRRSILCTLRSMVAAHVMGAPHSARNQPLSPSRSRSPSYHPRKKG